MTEIFYSLLKKGVKTIATIYSFLLSLDWTSELNLKEQPLIISIPKSLVRKLGIISDSPKFDVIKDKGVVSLVTSVPSAQHPEPTAKDDNNE